MFTDRVSREDKAIGIVRPALYVCLSVGLFPFYLLNRLTFDLEFLLCMGHDPSSPAIESPS